MKICSKCGKELPLDKFSWKNKEKVFIKVVVRIVKVRWTRNIIYLV